MRSLMSAIIMPPTESIAWRLIRNFGSCVPLAERWLLKSKPADLLASRAKSATTARAKLIMTTIQNHWTSVGFVAGITSKQTRPERSALPMPEVAMRTNRTGQPLVREYGCTICQRYHRETLDPEYQPHLFHQSKHGYYDRNATPNEVLALIRAETTTNA